MIKPHELYRKKKDCCGCELCSMVCARGVLAMKPDDEGFLYPSIVNGGKCVDCRRCIKVCPLKTSKLPPNQIINGFGGHAVDEIDIRKSSSGALSTILGRYFINSGGVVYGVRYTENFHSAAYSRATSVEELEQFRTSKYFQARKGDIFKHVKTDLIGLKNVLFVGLPCDVASLYNFLSHSYDNLYTVSLICHGVTSPMAHNDFCDNLETKTGSSIKAFSVRHKLNGFKPYYIKAEFANGEKFLEPFVSTEYDKAFKFLKRPSCYHCKFKLLNREFGLKADLVIGDFHGQKESDSFYNKWGASVFYVCSTKGQELVNKIEGFVFSEISVNGKQWKSPVLSVPTKPFLFHNLFSLYFRKYGLKRASNFYVIRVTYRYIQPQIKRFHHSIRNVQIRLFHKVFIW